MGPEEAHYYCGMSRDFFKREIGPLVPVIDLGGRAIGFDRLDIDAAIFQHKESNPRVASLWPKSPDSIWKPATGKGEIRKQIRGKKLCRRFTASTRAQAEAFYYYFLASDGTPVVEGCRRFHSAATYYLQSETEKSLARDAESKPWLPQEPPLFGMPTWSVKKRPHVLNADEQQRLLHALPTHLVPVVVFALNTGAGESVVPVCAGSGNKPFLN